MAAASSFSSSSSTSSIIRAWRTAFLTLRDETLHLNESCKPVGELLNRLIFSHSNSLVSASPNLPPHELTSDLLFLLELAATSCRNGPDFILVFSRISHLMHDICKGQRLSLQLNSSSWTLFLDSFAAMLQTFLNKPALTSPNVDAVRPAMQCLESVRHLVGVQQRFLLADDVQLGKFLLHIIDCSHAQLFGSSYTSQRSSAAIGKGSANYCGLWEFHTLAFAMLSEAFTRFGSTFPADTWQCTIEVLRKVMDALTSKSLLSDDCIMSRFYASLLNCLHLVLMDPKGSLLDHVSAFVATLRMFFVYGLTSRPQFKGQVNDLKEKEPIAINNKLTSEEPKRINQAPYRPPHLRKRESFNMNQTQDSSISSDNEYSAPDFTSSDSDCSDSDGSLKDSDGIQNSRVRVAAIVCIQDLCQADPRSFTSQWTILLPTNDVLQPRKFEATLMTCLLFDPYMKARIASASALAVMLDGPSSVFLQIAEYNESTKWGSFMALSSSLGCMLMQLHTGILYLIQREMHNRLLASLLKILVLLISSTPYARMPRELLPTVITSILSKIENRFIFRSDQSGQLASIISCLAAALSTSSPSPQVKKMLLEEISTGVVVNERSGVLFTLFRYSEQLTSPATCYEALQALRAVVHNYPNITIACWEHVSCIVSKIVALASPDIPMRIWKESMGDNTGFIGEKVITGAVKVLDECLRATSGFKGTEDLSDDKLLETPFVSDCTRGKKVSSAPSFEPESAEETEGESYPCQSGIDCWSQTIEQFIPQLLRHTSAMVRAAAVTCFAGITSFVFFSLTEEKQEFTVSSLIDAAVHDDVPSVRSAACRAIGVISCFPKFFQSAVIFEKFIQAIEINSRDPLVSVRITSSWALANICESLRQCVDGFPLKESADSNVSTKFTVLLAECALRLTKDGDKIKSNAVRALGNLSRFVKYTSSSGMHDKLRDYLVLSTDVVKELPAASNMQSHHTDTSNFYSPTLFAEPCLLEKIVQAFLSCVTTGNVKVQWNVCHALSNLFLNETLNLQDMDWAPSVFSILLLLLRDSSNFKIKIQAAAALAVPASVIDYGKSFPDVVQGLVHVLENLGSVQISAPSSFKYRAALEKQITSTVLHILTLASSTDQESLKDFLVKKALFLEEWLKALCFSLEETSNVPEGANSTQNQKKWMISKAVRSLVQVYEGRSYHTVADKLKKLDVCIQ